MNNPLLRTTITRVARRSPNIQLALPSKLINVLNTTSEVHDNVEKISKALPGPTQPIRNTQGKKTEKRKSPLLLTHLNKT